MHPYFLQGGHSSSLRLQYYFFDEGMDAAPSGNGFGLVAADRLEVVSVAKEDAVPGIGDGVAGTAEVRGDLSFADDAVDR
jgi:hypothetical protein